MKVVMGPVSSVGWKERARAPIMVWKHSSHRHHLLMAPFQISRLMLHFQIIPQLPPVQWIMLFLMILGPTELTLVVSSFTLPMERTISNSIWTIPTDKSTDCRCFRVNPFDVIILSDNMSVNGLTKDKQAMVFSIDLMLALVVITVVLGLSADAMDIAGSKMEDYAYGNSLERITLSSADMLIKTPGSPENWDELDDLSGVTPGLADMNFTNMKTHSNIISISKIKRLNENYDKLMMGRVIPTYCKSTLTIYPIDTSLEPIYVKNMSGNYSSTEVMVENRTVLCNYLNTSTLVFINAVDNSKLSEQKQLGEECPHFGVNGNPAHLKVDYRNRKSGWVCYHFRITQAILSSTDFYVMADPNLVEDPAAVWMIDRPENKTENTQFFRNTPILVNDIIREKMGNNSTAVLWLHVYSSGNPDKAFNTYLAGFPKGTSYEKVKVQYLNPQPCYFVLKVWF